MNDICDFFDICIVQEHWLLTDRLESLSFSVNFCSWGVSGVCNSLLRGCPFGGCGTVYRKKFSSMVSHLTCDSNRFWAISLKFNNVCVLLVCVYFPNNYHTDA